MSNAASPNGFNLQSAKAIVAREEAGVPVPIKNVDGSPLTYQDGDETKPVTVSVIGSYSKKFRALMDERTKLSKRLGRDATAEEDRAADLDLLADSVTGWAGFFDGDNVLECTKANVLTVISSVPWIEAQIDRACVTHDRFFGA